ncbi:MAG: isocitrate lyase/phosphoenolpyruvate mutase family protein [Rhodospirillales bacterium]
MSPQPHLKQRLGESEILVAPGIFDAFGAMMAERAGFEALYVSGASIAYTRLGRPDIGLVSLEEVASVVRTISERTQLPLIVDADTGYGNAINVGRTVRVLERAGAGAIQLEDQSLPKRCGHLAGKTLVSAGEMCGKIKAAQDARRDSGTAIVARTDAAGVEGIEAAMERAAKYVEAGADILFIEALQDDAQLRDAVQRFGASAPLLANMVEGGKTPMHSADELQALGYSIVIFPGGLVRALAHTAGAYFKSLAAHGSTTPYLDKMLDFNELNALLGTQEILDGARQYDEDRN